MPVLILIGMFSAIGIYGFANSCNKPSPPRNKDLNEQICNEMIGKSKRECRRILRKYRR